MKTRALNLFTGLIFLGVMFASFESQARPPLQHPARGAIQSIDPTNHTLVLAEPKSTTNRVFVWKNSTRFRVGWHKASPDALRVGQSVKVYYRRESGRLVLREVRWSETSRRQKQGRPSVSAPLKDLEGFSPG